MHARERVIRERFAAHICARCGRAQGESGLLVLARRHDTWLVLVTCPQCDHRGIFVVSFPSGTGQSGQPGARHQPAEAADLEVRALTAESLAAALPEPALASAVTLDDVARMRAFLQTFDGNFQRMFAES